MVVPEQVSISGFPHCGTATGSSDRGWSGFTLSKSCRDEVLPVADMSLKDGMVGKMKMVSMDG
jgi:hypothetical protein